MANAIEHAYRGESDGTVDLHATIRDDAMIEVVVRDHGQWREPDRDPGDRGRGFSMMASAGLQVDVVTSPDGTTVTLECPARRPAPVDQADAVAESVRLAAAPLVISADPSEAHVVRVGGAVDHRAAAAQVEAEVLRRSRNGLVPVTVDLEGVVHLGSAGVRVLESLLRTTDQLNVVAPPGTPAAQTLDVAGHRSDPRCPDGPASSRLRGRHRRVGALHADLHPLDRARGDARRGPEPPRAARCARARWPPRSLLPSSSTRTSSYVAPVAVRPGVGGVACTPSRSGCPSPSSAA